MDKDFGQGQDSVFTNKVRAGRRRTYFFDVRRTKGDDYYITLTESTKRFNGEGYNRHKIFLYKEDFNRFLEGLQGTVDHVKNELMPEYDYEQFDRKQEEWEKQQAEEADAESNETTDEYSDHDTSSNNVSEDITDTSDEQLGETDTEEDMSW